jgi:hypothetical protein
MNRIQNKEVKRMSGMLKYFSKAIKFMEENGWKVRNYKGYTNFDSEGTHWNTIKLVCYNSELYGHVFEKDAKEAYVLFLEDVLGEQPIVFGPNASKFVRDYNKWIRKCHKDGEHEPK